MIGVWRSNVFTISFQDPQLHQVFYFLCHTRRRRLHAQCTHILAPCVFHPEPSNPAGTFAVSLKQRRSGMAFEFVSLWHIARLLLRTKPAGKVRHSWAHAQLRGQWQWVFEARSHSRLGACSAAS